MATATETPPTTPQAATMPAATPPDLSSGKDAGPGQTPLKGLDAVMNRIQKEYAVPDTLSPAKTRQAKPATTAITETKTTQPAKSDEPVKTESKTEGNEKSDNQTVVDPAKGKTSEANKTHVEPASTDSKKEKINPWKEREEYKKLLEKSESEVLRLKKLIPNEQELTQRNQEYEQLKSQNKELLEHIRYLDYQKHPEFTDKYEKPYQEAWGRLMRRLNGVAVSELDGTKRPVDPADILKLSALPADQLLEQAEAKFGKLGTFVAERVEDLKQLWENKAVALEKAKKEGVDFFTKQQEAQMTQQKEITDFLASTWTKAVDEIRTHSKYGKYFNPVEGDDEFNAALEKGMAKADEALTGNPTDVKLTPEQRATIVKKHAALRHRAAAFGVLNLMVERLEAKLAEANKKLEQYQSSTPTTAGSQPQPNGIQQGDKWRSLQDRLAGYVKR